MMKKRLVAALALIAASPAPGQFSDQPECRLGADVPNPAVNCPDMVAWQKFVEAVTPVSPGVARFQTWSTDGDTFPCPPADVETCRADPKAPGCPVWPEDVSTTLARGTSGPKQLAFAGSDSELSYHQPDSCLTTPSGAFDMVYRNRATFDYILENGLYYMEGLEQAFQRGLDFNFPIDAAEVKVNWYPLSAAQVESGRFFTMEQNGTTYGMVSFIIITKDLQNWFWTTFEHADNPGRCDFIGCHDSFGVEPANQPPRYAPLCEPYPPGELTPAARRLLEPLPPVFRHYRLKGTQVDFTDSTGSPVFLGSSVSEAGFVPTSSCMTCHSRAAILGLSTETYGLLPYYNGGFAPNETQSFFGVPDSNWYYSANDPMRRWAVQTDFVWAIPLNANSLFATANCCKNGPPSGSVALACQCQADGVCEPEK